jgi:predicted CoA-substrate-specific enzyme activase
MIVAGCDIGSLTAKMVIIEDENILASAVIQSRTQPVDSAVEVIQKALNAAGLTKDDLEFLVGTGYGKEQIPFVNKVESEISCHARGARHLIPSTRMVIDIGGQDAKATRMDKNGKIVRYLYNDKCASGTGRFLEVMAGAMEIPLDKMGEVHAQSTEKLTISNQCVIFAETEVVSLINDGKEISDIINALHRALTRRVASLARSIEVEEDVVMTGGVAKNAGVFSALSEALGVDMKAIRDIDPQLVGALGAALYAGEEVRKGCSRRKHRDETVKGTVNRRRNHLFRYP